MSFSDLEVEPVAPPAENGAGEPAAPPGEQWQRGKNDREYIARKGKSGIIYRQGDETPDQARERDAKGPTDKRPRRKSKRPKMPEGPRQIDLKELEATLAEAFKSPALVCAMTGDPWAADHFTKAGPYLARNLINASEHNPWLRRKLEEAATGGDAMMKVMSLVPVAGAMFIYVVPPVIYWFNLPVPERARTQFGIPPRREREPQYAADSAQPQAAEFPEAA